MDESALIHRAQTGDLDAFNQLVLHYQDRLYNAAYRILGDADEAADAAQEAFIAAFRKIGSFRGGSFQAWLLRIVTNQCYDLLRQRKRRPAMPLEPDYFGEEAFESPRWLADDRPLPEEQTALRALDAAIQRCLDALPDAFRVVAVLVDVEGLAYAEAARLLRKPIGTIRSRLARARARLQDCLLRVRELFPDDWRLKDTAE